MTKIGFLKSSPTSKSLGGSNLIFFSVYQTPPLEDQISHIVAPSVDYAPTTSKLLVEDQDAAAF